MIVTSGVRAQPFVKWAGGKGALLPQLSRHFPTDYRTYFEPFLGGGAVFFTLAPHRAVLGDSNDELMNGYRVVREQVEHLMAALREHVYAQDHFYRVRKIQPVELGAIDRAARLIYLNKTCFNGLYRVNRKGEFNVPFGSFKSSPRLFDADNLRAASQLLQRADLHSASFDRTLASAGPGDFVYLDPPYSPLSETSFTKYTADGFVQFDQQWLKAQFDRLTERGCRVLLSNSDTPFTRWLYQDYPYDIVFAPRAINSNGDGRQGVSELIVRNYPGERF